MRVRRLKVRFPSSTGARRIPITVSRVEPKPTGHRPQTLLQRVVLRRKITLYMGKWLQAITLLRRVEVFFSRRPADPSRSIFHPENGRDRQNRPVSM
jgi:hypothetical protein